MDDLATIESSDSESIRARILTIRGVQVMLDRDLAELYGVPTKRLNEQVKRNLERFPERFMFQLTPKEVENLRSQIATSIDTTDEGGMASRSQIATLNNNKGRGHNIKYQPYAFTEHGVIMLASVLKSEAAAVVSIRITNAFVTMRRTLASLAPILARIETNERRQIADQAKNDANQARNEERFKLILNAMQDKKFPPQKVFYDGQLWDARVFVERLVRGAEKSQASKREYSPNFPASPFSYSFCDTLTKVVA